MLQLSKILGIELSKKIIDWERVRELLDKNRGLINEIDDDETPLSECFDYFSDNGKGCVTLTKLLTEQVSLMHSRTFTVPITLTSYV